MLMSGVIKKMSSSNSRTASMPCACQSTIWSAIGPTWSWPRCLEHQIVVRHDAAPKAGSRHLHSDGVSTVHESLHTASLSSGATGEKCGHSAPGLSADIGSTLQCVEYHRTDRLWLAPSRPGVCQADCETGNQGVVCQEGETRPIRQPGAVRFRRVR